MKLYHNFTSQEDIDREYNLALTVADIEHWIEWYAQESLTARCKLDCMLDVRFGPTVDETVDIFPAKEQGAPLLVFIHGGYWFSCSSKDYSLVAKGPVSRGITVVVTNYSLCPKVSISEITRQSRAVITWLHREAPNFNADPSRILVAGHSSGGHQVGMLSATDWLGEYGLPNDVIKGGIPISGVFDLRPLCYSYLQPKLLLTHEVLTLGIVHRMPDGLSYVAGALAEPCSSVLATHDKACTSLDDTVVVMGAGPIGCIHIAIAQARGARVIVSQRSKPRQEMARRFNPELVVDAVHEDLAAHVKRLTGGVGADLVICANPVAATQTQAVEIVRKGGRVVLFGGLPKANPMTTLDGNRIHYGEIEVVGGFSYHPTYHELALDVLQRGLVPVDLLVTHAYSLDEVDTAFETAASGQGLKVMVTM